jgi:3-phenylpropionate/trans-cinnamate dioxygenase ferredoxin reductase subunit
MSGQTIVVIGAGQAGAWAARTLRSEGFGGRIVLVGEEAAPPYERPPLSKDQLQPHAADMAYLMTPAQLAEHGIEWMGATTCVRIDRGNAAVVLSDGQAIGYDKLVLCTGGRARLPDMPGIGGRHVHTLRTVDDAQALRAALANKPRVLVIGGGWIGLEVAAAARMANCEVTLVEAGRHLCARTSSPVLSAWLAHLHTARGVALRMETCVDALEDSGANSCRAKFSDGSSALFDLVVVGIGLVQNDALARDAGLECDRGVVVDRQCRSSDPAIFAAGDVTAVRGPGGGLMRLESWQNAQDQAIAAARAALGQAVDYQPTPYFWSEQYQAMVQIAGACAASGTPLVRGAALDRFMAVEVDDGGRILFAVSTATPRDFRQLRKFITDGTAIDAARFADESVALAKVAL